MTVAMKPMTIKQRDKLRKIRDVFVDIYLTQSSAGMRARFNSALKRLGTFVERENLTLVRVDDNGDYHAIDKTICPWNLDLEIPLCGERWWQEASVRYHIMLLDFIEHNSYRNYALLSIQRS